MIEEGLYYLCSENKDADQLRSYGAADLYLCFCICKKLVFLLRGSFKSLYYLCSENKEADQLRSYCAADLHLCFCICKKLVFLLCGSFKSL